MNRTLFIPGLKVEAAENGVLVQVYGITRDSNRSWVFTEPEAFANHMREWMLVAMNAKKPEEPTP